MGKHSVCGAFRQELPGNITRCVSALARDCLTRCVSFEVALFGFRGEALPLYLAQPEGPEGLGTQFERKTKGQRPAGLHANRRAFGP